MQILFSAKKTFCDRQNKLYFKIVLLINAQQIGNFNRNDQLNIKYVQKFPIQEYLICDLYQIEMYLYMIILCIYHISLICRTKKYLQKAAATRTCAIGGFFVSIPLFLTGIHAFAII